METFVDTGAWLALSDRRDQYHTVARETYRHLIQADRVLVTTNLVVAEAYVLIRRAGGHAYAMRFLDSLRKSSRLAKVYSTVDLEREAEQLLRQYDDQAFSYTDAVSFAVMHDREIAEAFGFDAHFWTAGFSLLPTGL